MQDGENDRARRDKPDDVVMFAAKNADVFRQVIERFRPRTSRSDRIAAGLDLVEIPVGLIGAPGLMGVGPDRAQVLLGAEREIVTRPRGIYSSAWLRASRRMSRIDFGETSPRRAWSMRGLRKPASAATASSSLMPVNRHAKLTP